VHATFWLWIEHCSNRRRSVVPDESGPRFAWHTYQKPEPEKMASIYGAGSWSVCHTGLPWGLDFNPHTHPISTAKSRGNPHGIPIPTEPRNLPYVFETPLCSRTCVFLLEAYFVLFKKCIYGIYVNKHYFRCIHWLSYYLYSVMYSVMIMQEKIQKCHSTNSKFDFIPWNSSIDYDIIAYLTHFRLISTQAKIPTEFPQAHGDSSQSPYPSHTHTHGNPQE